MTIDDNTGAAATSAAPGPIPSGSVRCELREIRKSYGGIKALDGVSLDFRAGEVHALLGENGAGKSTLMKILAGAEKQDGGEVLLEGRPVTYATVEAANGAGVSIVFQELSLFPDLDVLSNLFAHREPTRLGVINRRVMASRAAPILAELGVRSRLDVPLDHIELHERQLIEVAKALLVDARVIVFDEPTSALSASEAERLLDIIRGLARRGVAVVFVSHRLEEVEAVADRASVLREGRLVWSGAMSETDLQSLITHMIGTAPASLPAASSAAQVDARPVLRLRDVSVNRRLANVNVEVRPGEIVGLAGLEDAGCRDVMNVAFGLLRPKAGTVELDNRAGPRSPLAAVKRGVAFVPADRRHDGLMIERSVYDNLSSVQAGVRRAYGSILRIRQMRRDAARNAAVVRVKAGSLEMPVGSLSGGNQQKVVLAKWLAISPRVVLLDDPTRGVDLGAKLEIYRVIRAMAERGSAILFSSGELEEYAHLCDRVLVMRRGVVKAELPGSDVSPGSLLDVMNT